MDTRFRSDFLSLSRQAGLVFNEDGLVLECWGRLSPEGVGDDAVFRGRLFWDLLEGDAERSRVRETLATLKEGVLNSLRKEIGFGVSLAPHEGARFVASGRATYRPVEKVYLLVLERPRKVAAESEHFVDHSLLHEIIETTPSVIVAKDVDGRCILANRKFRQIFNLSREQVLGRTAHDLFPAQVADNLRANDLRVIRSVKHETSFEMVRHADGTFCRYFSEKFPLLDPQGEVVGSATISTDVTALQDAEKRVREKQELLENILDNMPVVITGKAVGEAFPLVMWNKDAERFFGLAREQALGKTDGELFAAARAEGAGVHDRETLEKNLPVEIPEEQVETASGPRWLHTMKHCIRDEQGAPVLLLTVSVDITERKRNEKLLQEQNVKMIASAKMATLGEMSGGVAHEINNPLMIIQGWASHLRHNLSSPNLDVAAALKMIDHIAGMCERIAKIVKGLKTFARDGEQDAWGSASVGAIVADTIALCGSRFETHGIRLAVGAIAAECLIECRAVQISQVLANLLSNSFDALQDLDPARRWVAVETAADGEFVEISVADGGHGVPAAIVDKIFQPFFTTKPVGKGTGLGLSISSGIVESHGGSLTFDARTGQTRFVVRLPVRQPRAEHAA